MLYLCTYLKVHSQYIELYCYNAAVLISIRSLVNLEKYRFERIKNCCHILQKGKKTKTEKLHKNIETVNKIKSDFVLKAFLSYPSLLLFFWNQLTYYGIVKKFCSGY